MSLIDASLSFIPAYGPAQSMVSATAGLAQQVGNPIDLLGTGVGTAPANVIGQATLFGMDPGSGLLKPFTRTIVGTAFTTATSATMQIQLQYAVDTGVGGGYQPGTWQTIVRSGDITAAQMPAQAVLPKLEFEPTFPFNLRPRYIRLLATVNPTASGIFTAGTIAFALILMGTEEFAQKLATRNFAGPL